jgi:uncharacterized protein (DUF885 family)
MSTRLLVLSCLLFSLSVSAAERPVDHAEVQRLCREYLDGLLAARPHLASFMGDHRFDDRLMDLDEGALDRRRWAARGTLARIEAMQSRGPLAADDRIDLAIVRDGARLELLYLEEIRDYGWDPRLYDSFPYYDPREIVAGRLSDLMHGDFAPDATRRASVIAEVDALPRFLAQTESWLARPYRNGRLPANWRRPPKVYVEQAITGNRGRIDFFKTELRPFLAADKKGLAAYERAVVALDKYQRFLETELLAKADGDWRLGRALYDKKFPLALQTTRSPDEMYARAEAEFRKTRKTLAALAKKIHASLWPGQPLPGDDGAVIGKVKDALAVDHPKPDELVAAHGRKLDALRAFIEQHKLVPIPPRETLSVEAMPAFKRGSSAAEYLAPGILEQRPTFHATYYVDPIDPTWAPERVESYLRGQNDYEVELVAAHEAYPGHHTQISAERQALDPVRAVLWNGAMVEGWAVYGTSMIVAHGWGDKKNDRYRFFDLRGRMISASNTMIDIRLQRGEMSDEEAVRLMVEQGFQEKAMAEKKLLRAKLDSTQLCQYFLGLDEIEELRRDAHPSDEEKFNTQLISHGSIAVRFLREYLLGGR